MQDDSNPIFYWYNFKFWSLFIFVIALFIWADVKEIKGEHLKMIHLLGGLLIVKIFCDKYVSD